MVWCSSLGERTSHFASGYSNSRCQFVLIAPERECQCTDRGHWWRAGQRLLGLEQEAVRKERVPDPHFRGLRNLTNVNTLAASRAAQPLAETASTRSAS